ncbi:MAG: glutamate formimidoyltransferase [Deltaproteobacteria bacterium]|nr:glutamate formimidoyltransferase [Deltaproteobacteria bacterium]
MKLVECVPNFSEGRDRAVIDRIADAIRGVAGATLLDVDPGADTNRTVVTLVGDPQAAVEAAFSAIRTAAELIDMSKHHGAHARIGATDVCPFVPVSEMTQEECVALARQLGQRVGDELGIPVYLYEHAATRPERRNLADIRQGEYEGLAAKLRDPAWQPDFGPAVFNARSGATVIGARDFLIAYNINLNTREKKLAHDIALILREQGRAERDQDNKIVVDADGNKKMIPGLFRCVKAVGWYIDTYNCAQISINFTNHQVSPPHLVFDKACELAWERGLRVTGSELVGLIPKQALLEAGRHYLRKQKKSVGVDDDELVRVAVQSMGLSDIVKFDPQEKIIEHRIQSGPGRLVAMTGQEFLRELASDSPAPGGGSVSALAGAYSAALGAMVAALTHGKKGYQEVYDEMERLGAEAHPFKDRLLAAVDTDAAAFDAVMAALRLPKASAEDKARRQAAMLEANKNATLVPMGTLRGSIRPLEIAAAVAERGNQNSLSDAGVAGLMGRAAAEGAYYNVMINLPSVDDAAFRDQIRGEADQLLERALALADRIRTLVLERLRAKLTPST